MREVWTGMAVTCAVLAICMGAGEADMRAGAFVLAFMAGVSTAIGTSLRG
jgi:hypothetical protein